MLTLYNKEFLVANLCFVYRMIVASAPLLEFAIRELSVSGDLPLLEYYEKHLAEETGHDEMLRDDLERLGVTSIPRYHTAAEIAGAQYYLIAHDHPAALLGYMHTLERDTLSLATVETVEKAHGVELKAMRHHAEHDPDHVAALNEQITALPVQLRALVDWNARRVLKQIQAAIGKMANQVPLE